MPTKPIPALGAARLSKDADESTSIERQKSGINGWANLRRNTADDEYRVIEITEDSDVSGAVSPFDRAGLGTYLRKPLLDTWQVLVVFRLDRLTRSIADFEALWKFLEANGKTLVSVSEQIDFGTVPGRLMARQLVIFAEDEREMMRARVKNAYDSARAAGKYPGMQFPFGYIPVKLPSKGWGLEPHPVYANIVSEIARRLIGSESLSSTCRWLDAAGIPTPRNAVREYKGKKPLKDDARWNTTSLTAILKSPAVIGEATVTKDSGHGLEAFRDESGMAISRAEPLISRETWEQVKEILARNAAKISPSSYRAPLLRVAYCVKCKTALNITNATWEGKEYRYYRCPKERLKRGCDARRVNSDELESWALATLVAVKGHERYVEYDIIPAVDNRDLIYELSDAIGSLENKIRVTRKLGGNVSNLEAQLKTRRSEFDMLDVKIIGEQRKPRESVETWAEHFGCLDWNARNADMRNAGIRIEVQRGADGKPDAWMWGPLENQPGTVLYGHTTGESRAVGEPFIPVTCDTEPFAICEPKTGHPSAL